MNFIIVDRRLGGAQRNPTIPMKTLGYANAPTSHATTGGTPASSVTPQPTKKSRFYPFAV
jgi:hypothetical protein